MVMVGRFVLILNDGGVEGMRFCGNCGNQLTEEEVFCRNCGQRQEEVTGKTSQVRPVEQPLHTNSEQKTRSVSQPSSFFKSKRSKVITVIFICFAVLLFGGYYAVSKLTAPSAVVQRFIEAIKQEDVAAVKEFINEGQLEMTASTEQVKVYLNYLHDHPQLITSMVQDLKQQSELIETGEQHAIGDGTSFYMNLVLDGKKWGIFDRYVIQFTPYYPVVTTTIKEADIYFNDEKAGTLNQEEDIFGPFLPGEYNVKAVIEGDYGEVTAVQPLHISPEEQDLFVHLDWEENFVQLSGNYDDADLYINNKKTSDSVGELNALGPLMKDGSIEVYAQKEFSSGLKKSEVTTIKEDVDLVDLTIDFEEVEEPMEKEIVIIKEQDEATDSDEAFDRAAESQAVKDRVRLHYTSISQDSLSTAYNVFSSARKRKVPLDGWAAGFKENIRDDVTTLEVQAITEDKATVYLEMTSYDSQEDGSVLVQEWGGYWQLVKEDGLWMLDTPELKKLSANKQ